MNLLRRIIDRILRSHYLVERLFFYRNPRKYWTERGGELYYSEQESHPTRTQRSLFIASELAQLPVSTILEVGCGYGKQLLVLSRENKFRLCGMDFSHSQLLKACRILDANIPIVEADAEKIPFRSDTFDLVFSSAVILHNHPEKASHIVAEMIRISKGYLAHNEDKNISATRYAYDFYAFYQSLGFEVIKNAKIQSASDPERTQFIIASFDPGQKESLSLSVIKEKFLEHAALGAAK